MPACADAVPVAIQWLGALGGLFAAIVSGVFALLAVCMSDIRCCGFHTKRKSFRFERQVVQNQVAITHRVVKN